MEHPKESGINRRQLLRRSAGAAAGLTAAGALAGCENTTTPIGAETAAGQVSGAAAELVVPKPLGPAGLPLPRPDNSVTWAITDDNKPIADGATPEPGPLRIYNYADYIDPATVKKFQAQFNTKVQIATYNSADEAIAKLASGAVEFDLIMGLSGSNIVNLIAQKLIKPLNHSYLPEPREEHLAELADPFYDRGAATRSPTSSGWTASAGATTRSSEDIPGMDVPWDIFWEAQEYRGQVGILDDRRDALSMPMQRDAMRKGVAPRPQHRGRRRSSTRRRERPLRARARSATRRSRSPTTRRCPRARRCSTTRGRATCSAAPSTTCPRASRRASSPSGARTRTASSRTTSSVIGRTAKSPVLAHEFINFLLDEKNAYDNFVNFTGYTPPQNEHRRGHADQAGRDPGDARSRRSSGRTSSPRTRSCCS